MSQILYQDKNYTTAWHADSGIISVRSLSYMDSSGLRAAVDAGIDGVVKYRAKTWVSDTTDLTTPMRKDDEAWIGTEAVPRGVAAGLKAVITIVPKSALARLGGKKVSSVVAAGGLIVADVASWDEAVNVANDVAKKAA